MSATFRIDGLPEQIAEMTTLPQDLTQATQPILDGAAQSVAADIQGAYPRRTGRLAAGVQVAPARTGDTVAAARIVNTAPHAAIFEHGTAARHTALGANRGMMPAGNVFIPRMIRVRRELGRDVAAVMTAKGLTVTET